jgi:hypothetical protein
MIEIGKSDFHEERKRIRERMHKDKIKLLIILLTVLTDGSSFRVIVEQNIE